MHTISQQTELFSALSQGATVITPNNRMSLQLLEDWAQSLAHPIIDKPLCMAYPLFLQQSFIQIVMRDAMTEHPLLFNPLQERMLWEKILNKHFNTAVNAGLIDAVQNAFDICEHWHVSIQKNTINHTAQTHQFQQWRDLFLHQLHTCHAIVPAMLPAYLTPFIPHIAPQQLIWACFDEFTPAQKTLQIQLQAADCQQFLYEPTAQHHTPLQHQAFTEATEVTQLALWLKEELSQGKERIAVVVPDLQTRGDTLKRALGQYIAPETFNMSLGKSLFEYPIIAHALSWITLTFPLHHQSLHLLLHSPYLKASKEEFSARAQCLETLHLLEDDPIPPHALMKHLSLHAPILADCLKNLSPYPATAHPDEWVSAFQTRLNALGFPGEYPLDSTQYQCLERFHTLLDEFRQLAPIHPTLSFQDAITYLQQLATHIMFQPKARLRQPIQILGWLEASGCTFDSIWIMGLTDQILPQSTQFSAFIPIEYQRTHHLPKTCPARELKFATTQLQRLRHSCHHLVCSYPHLLEDIPQLPSPLIKHFDAYQEKPIIPVTPITMETIFTPTTIPLAEQESIHGGATLLGNQAKCPFRAFAAHRLHAKKPPARTVGPNPLERGNIVHRLMEQCFGVTPITDEKIIEQYIQTLLTELGKRYPASCSKPVLAVERQRLLRLVHALTIAEKSRAPFKVLATEKEATLNINGLSLKLRMDRVDETTHGAKWIIDYKTSFPAQKPWQEECPEAPQLLLYALLDTEIRTLAFIQLKAGKALYRGLSETPQSVPGITTLKKDETWSEQQAAWHERITTIATAFQAGYCAPIPQQENTCHTCEFIDLCRKT